MLPSITSKMKCHYIKFINKKFRDIENFEFNLEYLENNSGVYLGKYSDLIRELAASERKNILETKSWKEKGCYLISKNSLIKCEGKNKIFKVLYKFKV